jgi:hypothetical protein
MLDNVNVQHNNASEIGGGALLGDEAQVQELPSRKAVACFALLHHEPCITQAHQLVHLVFR